MKSTGGGPLVAALILNYNNEGYTIRCMESLLASDYSPIEIVLVDNGSEPGSYNSLKERFENGKGIHLLRIERNIGYAGGSTHGVEYIRKDIPEAKYIFFLNDDTTQDRNCITELVRAAEARPEYAILGPMICDYDDHNAITTAGCFIDPCTGIPGALHEGKRRNELRGFHDVGFVHGAALFIRADILRYGWVDRRFFTYWEEVDFEYRIRSRGYKIGLVADACAYHRVGATTHRMKGRTLYYDTRNRLIFLKRWSESITTLLRFHLYTLFYRMPRTVVEWLALWREPGMLRYYFAGLMDGYLENYDRKVA